MKSSCLLAAALAVIAQAQQSPMALQEQCSTQCAQNALSFAYAYGFPLHAYGVFVRRTSSNPQTNTLYHSRKLAGPEDTAVVSPNSDTVYSSAFIDLSENDIEIEVPDFGDRYWLWPFHDVYANDLANIGSTTSSPPGKYLVRFDQTNYGVQTENVKGGYQAYLNLPTPYGIAFARILVDSNKAGDLEAANALQDQMNMTIVPRFSPPIAPSFDLGIFNDSKNIPGADNHIGDAVLRLTAAIAPYNEPYIPQDRSWVAQILHYAGIRNNTFTQPPDTNLTAAIATANASVTALNTQPGFRLQLGNNWTATPDIMIGAFGSFYQARYAVAIRGYLALIQKEVLYPVTPDLKIGPDQAVLFQFSAKPKIKKGGFWSLTVYDGDRYLVANRLDRYTLGDRSNITFSNGTELSGSEKDGPFEVLIQPNDVVPPQNWTTNWLPAPDGGGPIYVTFRLYGPEPEMTNGSWVYPRVSVVDAIRE